MMFTELTPEEKRRRFREALVTDKLLRFPGAFSPLVAMLIEQLGFEGVYISGSVLSNDLGYPDIGLTTASEVGQRGRMIARASKLPTLIDIDTGFGEPLNAARTVLEFEELGLAGVHLEDQINPKRCGHLDNKALVDTRAMVLKLKAACSARRDSNFLIMARTDARASEGLEKSIDRAKAYEDAGADAIFPEALQDEKEFAAFRKAISVPLLANMTEFGKSKLLSTEALEDLGYNLVIYPVTTLRLAMKAVEDGLRQIARDGTQENIVDKMQTRQRLYEITHYDRYTAFDQDIFNFTLK